MKNYCTEISRGKLDMQKSLIGLEISDAKKTLGYWWTLESYFVNNQGGYYCFARSGNGKIQLKTDKKNIVIDI